MSASSAAHSVGYGAQAILNAVAVPPRRAQRDARTPIPVRARVVWETDGQEILDVDAIGWTSRLVWIQLRDPRSRLVGVWLPAHDVRRRKDQRATWALMNSCCNVVEARPSPSGRFAAGRPTCVARVLRRALHPYF